MRATLREGYKIIEENDDKTKTWKILQLHSLSLPTSYVARMLDVHYSFVHTVLTNAGKRPIKRPTKSENMRKLFEKGYSVREAANQTNSHYSFAHGVYKDWYSRQINNQINTELSRRNTEKA